MPTASGMLLMLLDEGYERQLLLSQDVCMKMQLRRYGGHGYSHILRHTVPSLRRRGVDRADAGHASARESAPPA